ncbi:uncharacterized protein LOC131230867 [Magnolia sinica]|uniref:uncharacterized protein LOC131230867 n=1 Tax=Magnolia sinica TaxID=86752 RepID=UPI00265857A7|nr:uncharacterized protein LOC131230867 [Magnolia sinica]XP_058082875.1 uncharacterized protein LOC131230867 [Magnolia sinica]
MVSSGNGKFTDEIQEDRVPGRTGNGYKATDSVSLHISTSQRGLLGQQIPKKGFLRILTALPSKAGFMKFKSRGILASPSAKFRRIAEERDEISRSVAVSPSSQGPQNLISVPFVGKIDWESLKKMCKEWIRDPMNMALLVWITCVAVSGAILFLVMTGMLDRALRKKAQRNAWFEVNNQILNALFTLMCLYQHPKRFYHLVLLCRWRPDDVRKLRKIYCKNGTYKPHEWMHMMVVVILLHVNCFAQYALCGLNLGYRRSERPAIGVGLCVSVAIAAPAIAGVYSILSPLGKEYESETDHEAQNQVVGIDSDKPMHLRTKSLQKRYSFVLKDSQRTPESRPEWRGGLFDLWDDISTAYLSLFCGFCVFGWNMERLGFGNMYVHIATFLLFCMAPFWIFNLAAINIDNEVVREALGFTGIVLCVFGLLYGGFWRIQMRKRFNLPANNFCCGYPAVTDCMQWLCCCMCSLAQEVRTGDFYDVEKDGFYRKHTEDSIQPILSPLGREDRSPLFQSSPSSPLNTSPSRLRMGNSPSPSHLVKGYGLDGQLPAVEEELSSKVGILTPPVMSSIQREVDHQQPI